MEDISRRSIENLEKELYEKMSGTFTDDQIDFIKDLIRIELMKRDREKIENLVG